MYWKYEYPIEVVNAYKEMKEKDKKQTKFDLAKLLKRRLTSKFDNESLKS